MSAHVKREPGQLSPPPAASQQQPRSRRKRVAIEIPADIELEKMDPRDVKKIKNRIAAARLRERSQQQIRELQTAVEFYKARAEYLEALTATCARCSSLEQVSSQCQHQPSAAAAPLSLQHHLPSLQLQQSFDAANGSDSQCNSPSSSTDDEYMGDCNLTLDDIDSDLLAKMLLMTE
ncbi:hypothetical protein PybrP1_009363 [[Pythium] brassicae (nom. inval.)]|nr:hypothetical protein PybrP1_009363 [[Pythium] brassicae (nom. inval.)]